MITPALFILASASLIATALVRLARVVDRVRKLGETERSNRERSSELDRSERRAYLAVLAVALFFAAVVVFVAAGVAIAIDRASADRLSWLPVGLALLGMALIVAGGGSMVFESVYSVDQIRTEIASLRRKDDGAGAAEPRK